MALHKALLGSVAGKAARLREVRKLRQEPGASQRWFQGPDGCDVFLWYDERRGLAQVQLTFERRVLEWTPRAGVRTGRLRPFDPLRPNDDLGLLAFDARPDAETLELAAVLLDNAAVDEMTVALLRRELGLSAWSASRNLVGQTPQA